MNDTTSSEMPPPQTPPKVEKGDTLANVLRRRIADDILSERLPPGTRLDERSLARDSGVSRTPIREALQQLVAAGLATSRPHAGTVVRGVDPSRVASMSEASILLETVCARLAAGRMTAVEVGRLWRIHESCQTSHLADYALGYAAENRKFHSVVIEGAKNPDLRDAVEFVRLRIAPFQRAPFASAERRDASQAEHARIIGALDSQRSS